MYGLLIENISQYIQTNYSLEKWNEIRRQAQIEETAFSVHKTYPDVYTKNIINKACQVRLDCQKVSSTFNELELLLAFSIKHVFAWLQFF